MAAKKKAPCSTRKAPRPLVRGTQKKSGSRRHKPLTLHWTLQDGSSRFPVVGIGASAGGLDALKNLFEHLPTNTGMVFVVVQHLDPKHSSLLTEILSRVTRMPVVEVTDGKKVVPDTVYVIPPNTRMAIMHNTLCLLPRCRNFRIQSTSRLL